MPPRTGEAAAPERGIAHAQGNRLRDMVDAHHTFIWRWLRGLGVPSSGVDDAVQHVFLIASQKIDAIVLGSERAFLAATARGVAANVRRLHQRSREELDDGNSLARVVDGGPNPEEALGSFEQRQLLETILDAMPDELREVFVSFELENLTVAEIAEIFDIPRGTAASRLRRAREHFDSATKRYSARFGERK